LKGGLLGLLEGRDSSGNIFGNKNDNDGLSDQGDNISSSKQDAMSGMINYSREAKNIVKDILQVDERWRPSASHIL